MAMNPNVSLDVLGPMHLGKDNVGSRMVNLTGKLNYPSLPTYRALSSFYATNNAGNGSLLTVRGSQEAALQRLYQFPSLTFYLSQFFPRRVVAAHHGVKLSPAKETITTQVLTCFLILDGPDANSLYRYVFPSGACAQVDAAAVVMEYTSQDP